jgi:hypothetical protein
MTGIMARKRSTREVAFATLGALVLMSTFVFKEVLLEPLKEAMSRTSVAIAEFDDASNIVSIADQIQDLSAAQLANAAETVPGMRLQRRILALWGSIGVGVLRYELSRRLEEGLSKRVIYKGSFDQLSDRNRVIKEELDDCHSLIKETQDSIDNETQVRGLEEKVERCRQQVQTDFGVTLGQTIELRAQVDHYEWRVTLYTYVTWMLFGAGLSLALAGKIFHISGVESVGD